MNIYSHLFNGIEPANLPPLPQGSGKKHHGPGKQDAGGMTKKAVERSMSHMMHGQSQQSKQTFPAI